MTRRARRITRLWLPALVIGSVLNLTPGQPHLNGLQLLGFLFILAGTAAVILETR